MKRLLLPVLCWALAMSHLFAQNQLPLSLADYAVNWSYSVKNMLQAGGYDVPGPKAEFELTPKIRTRSNELQLDSTVTYFGYNEGSSDSLPLLRNVYNYPQHNIEVITEYYYDLGQWHALARTTLNHDELGRLLEAFAQYYDEDTKNFIPDSRVVLFPHGLTEEADSFFVDVWSAELNDYVRQLAVYNTFDDEDRIIESLSSIELFEFPILFLDRNRYNHAGELFLTESFSLDGEEEIPAGRTEYWYSDGLLSTETTYISEGPQGFIAERKIDYLYFPTQKLSTVSSYEWDAEKTDWKLIHVTGYGYDGAGRINLLEDVDLESGSISRTRKTTSYVRDEYVSAELKYNYDNLNDEWVLDDKTYFYYDGLSANEPDPDPVVADAVFLYPNPSSGMVQVKLPGKVSVHIYTLTGQFVQKFYLAPGERLIDLGALPAGIYQVLAKSDEDYFSGKLAIQ